MKKCRWMIILVLILSTKLVVGCKESTPEIKGKYTIWIGGDIVQIGKQAQEYETKNGMIIFRDFKTGQIIEVPLSNIGSIETN